MNLPAIILSRHVNNSQALDKSRRQGAHLPTYA